LSQLLLSTCRPTCRRPKTSVRHVHCLRPYTGPCTNKLEQVQCHSVRYVTSNHVYKVLRCHQTWDGQPWNSVAETAARLDPSISSACHSLLSEVMPLVLCSHNAAVSHTQTPSLALRQTGTCCLLTHQHSTPSMPSRVRSVPERQNIFSALLLTSSCLSCWKRGVPGRCAFILRERLHFYHGRRRRRRRRRILAIGVFSHCNAVMLNCCK